MFAAAADTIPVSAHVVVSAALAAVAVVETFHHATMSASAEVTAQTHVVALAGATLAARSSVTVGTKETVYPQAVLGALCALTATGHLRPWEAFTLFPTFVASVRAAQAIGAAAIYAAAANPVWGPRAHRAELVASIAAVFEAVTGIEYPELDLWPGSEYPSDTDVTVTLTALRGVVARGGTPVEAATAASGESVPDTHSGPAAPVRR
jgi:hypothetical protein